MADDKKVPYLKTPWLAGSTMYVRDNADSMDKATNYLRDHGTKGPVRMTITPPPAGTTMHRKEEVDASDSYARGGIVRRYANGGPVARIPHHHKGR